MSDTPRTDVAEFESPLSEDEWPDFARRLERELAECRTALKIAQSAIDAVRNEAYERAVQVVITECQGCGVNSIRALKKEER